MRILGLDPGLQNMGWGAIDVEGSRIRHVGNGVIHSGSGGLAGRLLRLFQALRGLVAELAPDVAAVEQTFVNKDAQGTLKLGHARAVALLAPAEAGVAVAEYAPNRVKKTVVGVGHADKRQVEHMVRLQFPGVRLAGPDATDALAIALCHAHFSGTTGRLEAAIRAAGGGA